MLVTNHVLSGAVIGAVTDRPGPAFLLGVGSHFVLDATPHWGKWGDDLEKFMRVAVPDGLTGLAFMAGLAALAPAEKRAAVVAGMMGATLPDLDKPSFVFFGRSPFPRVVDEFHGRIQREAPRRAPYEVAVATAFLGVALWLLRGSARGRQ
jgi:hypothetical protein